MKLPQTRSARIALCALSFAAIWAVLAGIGLGIMGRGFNDTQISTQEKTASASDFAVTGTIQKVDPTARTVEAKLSFTLPADLRADGDLATPTERIEFYTSSQAEPEFVFEKNRRITSKTVKFEIDEGEISDYPFDTHHLELYFSAMIGDRVLPLHVTLGQSDPLFSLSGSGTVEDGVGVVRADFQRSAGANLMAILMMIVMVSLTSAILIATVIILRQRLGLVWPALGWMAASLFALTTFRGMAPGTPPIGSVMDYAVFFWCELLIALCLSTVVVVGALKSDKT